MTDITMSRTLLRVSSLTFSVESPGIDRFPHGSHGGRAASDPIIKVLRGEYRVSGARVSGARVSGVSISRARVSGVSISGARVSGARVSGGRVSGARVSGVRVSGARVSRVRVSGGCAQLWNTSSRMYPQPCLSMLLNASAVAFLS